MAKPRKKKRNKRWAQTTTSTTQTTFEELYDAELEYWQLRALNGYSRNSR